MKLLNGGKRKAGTVNRRKKRGKQLFERYYLVGGELFQCKLFSVNTSRHFYFQAQRVGRF